MDRPSPPSRSRRYPIWVVWLAPIGILLHQTSWLWSGDRLVVGLPIGLLYHIVLSVFWSVVMLVVTKRAWPRYLNKE